VASRGNSHVTHKPTAVYRPSPVPSVLLPLGPERGVGQFPSQDAPDEPALLPAQSVAAYKGADLFVGRFEELFGRRGGVPAPVPRG
jgi:hypothetical protein